LFEKEKKEERKKEFARLTFHETRYLAALAIMGSQHVDEAEAWLAEGLPSVFDFDMDTEIDLHPRSHRFIMPLHLHPDVVARLLQLINSITSLRHVDGSCDVSDSNEFLFVQSSSFTLTAVRGSSGPAAGTGADDEMHENANSVNFVFLRHECQTQVNNHSLDVCGGKVQRSNSLSEYYVTESLSDSKKTFF
jgi:hypothetical protein